MKTKTHVNDVRDHRNDVRTAICAFNLISEEERFWIVFDHGISFLKETYPPDQKLYKPMHERLVKSKHFWSWFRLEWNHWEREYLAEFHDRPILGCKQFYIQEIGQMIHDAEVEHSFHLFIKIFKHKL